MNNLPPWAWYLIAGIVVIGVLALASQYIDAATGLLPGKG